MTIVRNLGDLANQVDSSGTLNIGGGGTSATTANSGFNALAPSQTSNTNKYLTTNGTNTSWAEVVSGMTVTSITYSGDDQAVDPSNPLPVTINGSNFVAGSLVYVDTIATANSGTSINVTSSSTIVFTPPSGKSANSYNVWVVSPTGTIAILANGILYSGAPSWAGQSTSLSSGGTVSIQLTATGDTPLTYSLVSGTLPTGTTLSSSGLISGTTTSEGTFPNIVVMASDPQQQDANITIQITITLGDPYFEYVTLLLTGDGANGVQNNTFVDSSTNAYSITRNGNTTQGSFSPYGSLWSNYFPDAYLRATATNSNWSWGSSDFTIECWFNCNPSNFGQPYNYLGLMQKGDGSYAGDWDVSIYASNTKYITMRVFDGSSWVTAFQTTWSWANDNWNHLAFVRSSGVISVYGNGTLLGTNSFSSSVGNTSSSYFDIGRSMAYNTYTKGYISNVRLNNTTAVYTGAFTPSTTPLTAVSGTMLLTCQSNRFIDNSANAFTLTPNSSPSVQRFSPFNPTVPYSTATIGGSGYFDGSGDYLQSSGKGGFATNSTFTLEFWTYPLSSISDVCWINSSDNNKFYIETSGGTVYVGDGSINTISASAPPLNQWTHVALSFNGTTYRLYYNGVQQASSTNVMNGNSFTGFNVGQKYDGTRPFNGYINDVRILVGTNLYPSGTTFTPPTSPLTAITNTALLLNMTNAGIFDSAMRNDWITNNTAQISTSVKKFGTGSMWFDSSIASSHLQIPMGILNTALNASTFTIETWVYRTTGGGSYQCILSGNSDTMDIIVNGSNMFITSNTSNGTHIIDGAYTQYLPVNTWVHLALVCQEGTYYLYFDGINRATGTGATGNNNRSTDYTTNYTYWLGARGDMYGIGYLDDFRITTGIARYPNGTTFTPPTAAFPTN